MEFLKSLEKNQCVTLVYIPQRELLPYVKYIIELNTPTIIYHNVEKSFLSRYLTSLDKMICINCIHYPPDNLFPKFKQMNIKFNKIILHNFAFVASNICDKLITQKYNITTDNYKVLLYADGSRNNYKSESTDQSQIDYHTLLNKHNIKNTLYFFGFIHNSFCDDISNTKIIEYNEQVYPKLDMNINIPKNNIAIFLSRYLNRDDYQTSTSCANIFQHHIDLLFDNTTSNFIKYDNRILDIPNSMNNIKDFNTLIVNSKEYLLEEILLNNLDILNKITKIFLFDSSFPLLFQLPRLYNNLNKNIEIYLGFDYGYMKKYATNTCIELLTKRTIEIIINVNKLKLFDVYLEGKIIQNDKIDDLKKGTNFLFTLKKI